MVEQSGTLIRAVHEWRHLACFRALVLAVHWVALFFVRCRKRRDGYSEIPWQRSTRSRKAPGNYLRYGTGTQGTRVVSSKEVDAATFTLASSLRRHGRPSCLPRPAMTCWSVLASSLCHHSWFVSEQQVLLSTEVVDTTLLCMVCDTDMLC